MTVDLTCPTWANEAAAEALHQHGPARSDADAGRHGQTPRWQDCPRAEVHEGAGRDVARAVLDAAGHDALVVERARLREATERCRHAVNMHDAGEVAPSYVVAAVRAAMHDLARAARARALDGDS